MALIKIFQQYHQLVEHIEHVASNPVDPDDPKKKKKMFSPAGVSEADRLALFWKSKNTVMMVAFNIDVMAIFERQSLAFQKNDHSLIGQAKAKKSLIEGIQELKADPAGGPTTKEVLLNSICYTSAEEKLADQLVLDLYNLTDIDAFDQTLNLPHNIQKHLNETIRSRNACYSIEDFETTQTVSWRRKRVGKNGEDISEKLDLFWSSQEIRHMSALKEEYLDTILANIYEYFPEGDSSELIIFDQRLWGTSVDLMNEDLVKSQIESARIFLGVESSEFLLDECYKLLSKLWEEEKFSCANKQTIPTHYWGNVLKEDLDINEDDSDMGIIKMSALLRRLIQTAIVIPMGSAEAERSFSVMNHVKPKDKASLGMDGLEAQIRIRMNGPPYYSLDIDPYTEYYLAPDVNKRRCDKTSTPKKQKYSLNQDEYDNLPTTPAKYSGIY